MAAPTSAWSACTRWGQASSRARSSTSRAIWSTHRTSPPAPTLPRPHPVKLPEPSELELESVMRPRDAFFGPAESVPVEDSVGRIAAEQITPYPPGIPAVVPGERINRAVIDYLRSGLEAGMVLPDPADPKLETVRVSAQAGV